MVDSTLFLTLAGVFLMSAGASAINHIIERYTDALMQRTMKRPLPSGRMSIVHAGFWASLFLISGTIVLFLYANPACTILGLFNVIWYNLVYTPLKKISVWAVFAGTITGIIPFFMGSVAATNLLPNKADYFIALYMFLWQIPHFFLLIGKYGKEYELAGLASITQKTTTKKIALISYIWMIACCISSLFLPLFGVTHHRITGIIILIISLVVFILAGWGFFGRTNDDLRTPFITTNLMQAGFMAVLVIDGLI